MDDGRVDPIGILRLAEAMRIVSAQADCTGNRALVLMSDRSTANGCTAEAIAAGVIDGTIRFD
jgi:hypothetical protein